MDKKIKQILLILKVSFFSDWCVVILFYFLGKKMDFDFCGTVEPKSQTEYILQILCVAGVLLLVPLALKLFTLNTTNNLKRMNFDQALSNYMVWSMVRMTIIWFVAIFCEIAYFATFNFSCGVCALIAMAVTFLCYPSEGNIRNYLETLNND